MTYVAKVNEDWATGRARLLVGNHKGDGTLSVLLQDGTWTTVADGVAAAADHGIDIPLEALTPIAEAIARFLGKDLPSVAEIAVLREWLEVEKSRVERLIDLYLRARPSSREDA